ncbi:acyl-CoA dehydrogenase family protein [Janibacter terrae]|uniref:acyl-CoA dehydrogenase family protein n=1 Tax=Janibacter terrae TaxID=103817 RepID=UPI0008392CEA|nr:acyl-CoA dehydrogenase family protein [Janibacter terrae]MBA4084264.1 acyl-CoA dehydrogenase [Kytococcus sp.]
MHRTLFDSAHEDFRSMVRRFFADRAVPRYEKWMEEGHPDREFWLEAGELGLLGVQIPEEHGGGGESSFLYNVILTEEAQHAGLALGGVRVHTDICMPYFLELATPEQQARWLPKLATGEAISALAMSEPGAGSDVKAMSTRAVRDGDHYVVNGSKTFITNGLMADLVILAVKTDPEAGRKGISLLVVETDTPGFERGRRLDKIGLKSQDLAELSFTDMRVPVANLLGEENAGFGHLTRNLAQERLSIAVNSQAAAARAVETTVEYVTQRHAFGTTVGSFQNTKFELAACATDVEAGQSLLDRALLAHEKGELTPADAAKVKLFCTELQGRVVDRCLQLYGGYGYILEYPIARAYADARVTRIYAGSSEIMKTIIAKDIGL